MGRQNWGAAAIYGGDWWNWGGREGGPRVRGFVCGADGEVGGGREEEVYFWRRVDGLGDGIVTVEGGCVMTQFPGLLAAYGK